MIRLITIKDSIFINAFSSSNFIILTSMDCSIFLQSLSHTLQDRINGFGTLFAGQMSSFDSFGNIGRFFLFVQLPSDVDVGHLLLSTNDVTVREFV